MKVNNKFRKLYQKPATESSWSIGAFGLLAAPVVVEITFWTVDGTLRTTMTPEEARELALNLNIFADKVDTYGENKA